MVGHPNETGRFSLYFNTMNQLLSKADGEVEETYTYDKRGNLSQIAANGQIKNLYLYGALNRLEQAVNGKGETARYEYNGLGHRVGKEVGEIPNPLQSISKQTDSLNSMNLLESQTISPEKQIQYTIDLTREYHNLLGKEEDNRAQTFLWDGNVAGMLEDGKEYASYYLQDELGSPIRLAEEDGKLSQSYGYDEFGQDLYGNQGQMQPFGYTGYQKDGVAGTYFAQAREYLEFFGMFIGVDRIAGVIMCPKTLNLYNYCVEDPLNKTDKTGYWFGFDDLIAGGVGAIVGGVGQLVSDGINSAINGRWEFSSLETYTGAIIGGAAGGVASLYVTPAGGAAIAAGVSTLVAEGLEKITGTTDRSVSTILTDTVVDSALGGVLGKVGDVLGLDKLIKIKGVTSGRNSFSAIFASGLTKL